MWNLCREIRVEVRMICAQCKHKMDPNYYYIIQEWDTNELETEITFCSNRCMVEWMP